MKPMKRSWLRASMFMLLLFALATSSAAKELIAVGVLGPNGEILKSCSNADRCGPLAQICQGAELTLVAQHRTLQNDQAECLSWTIDGEETACLPVADALQHQVVFDQPGEHTVSVEIDGTISNGVFKIRVLDPVQRPDICLAEPRPISPSCCCGDNVLHVPTSYPAPSWAIKQNGHFQRMWWDRKNREEQIDYTASQAPLVPGKLLRNPFGDGAIALNDAGEIVAVVQRDGRWTTELVREWVVRRAGGVRPCALFSTVEGKYKGIWAVTENAILRIYKKGGRWQHYSVALGGNHASRIAPSSLYESGQGQLAGLLKNGQRWGIWHKDNDPSKMQFDYSAGKALLVPPEARCERR